MNITAMIEELKSFDWNDLGDIDTVGAWPGAVKFVLTVVLFCVCLGGGYWFDIKILQASLEEVIAKEVEIKAEFEAKAVQATNLDIYRKQLVEMEASFGALLRQLPSKTEVPGLLEDITHTGLGSGLEFANIQLSAEVVEEFYVELPMLLKVRGSYHDFGAFVSGVASLPRIVTLHDFDISAAANNRSNLAMTITAKTYRYNSGDE